MLQLTTEEEKNLRKHERKTKKQIPKYHTKNPQFCNLNHELTYIYWRSHVEKNLGRVKGLYYCPICEKVYKAAVMELKNNECL